MPTLAVIAGTRICMYYADHDPPHFHAIAGEHEVIVTIANLNVIDGCRSQPHDPPGTALGCKTPG